MKSLTTHTYIRHSSVETFRQGEKKLTNDRLGMQEVEKLDDQSFFKLPSPLRP
jgi:hypothetical protein